MFIWDLYVVFIYKSQISGERLQDHRSSGSKWGCHMIRRHATSTCVLMCTFCSQNYLKKTKCENLVMSMMSDMSPGTRKYLNIPVVVMEILPPLMDIIQPTFRPVSYLLYLHDY